MIHLTLDKFGRHRFNPMIKLALRIYLIAADCTELLQLDPQGVWDVRVSLVKEILETFSLGD